LKTAGSSRSKTLRRAGEDGMSWTLQNNSSANETWLWVVWWYEKKHPQVSQKRWGTEEFICDKPLCFCSHHWRYSKGNGGAAVMHLQYTKPLFSH